MTCSSAYIANRAEIAGYELNEVERIAVAMKILMQIRQHESWASLRAVERFVGDQANELLAIGIEAQEREINVLDTSLTITIVPPNDDDDQEAMSRDCTPMRATWSKIRAAEARFSNSLAGDILGAILICVISIFIVIGIGVLQ